MSKVTIAKPTWVVELIASIDSPLLREEIMKQWEIITNPEISKTELLKKAVKPLYAKYLADGDAACDDAVFEACRLGDLDLTYIQVEIEEEEESKASKATGTDPSAETKPKAKVKFKSKLLADMVNKLDKESGTSSLMLKIAAGEAHYIENLVKRVFDDLKGKKHRTDEQEAAYKEAAEFLGIYIGDPRDLLEVLKGIESKLLVKVVREVYEDKDLNETLYRLHTSPEDLKKRLVGKALAKIINNTDGIERELNDDETAAILEASLILDIAPEVDSGLVGVVEEEEVVTSESTVEQQEMQFEVGASVATQPAPFAAFKETVAESVSEPVEEARENEDDGIRVVTIRPLTEAEALVADVLSLNGEIFPPEHYEWLVDGDIRLDLKLGRYKDADGSVSIKQVAIEAKGEEGYKAIVVIEGERARATDKYGYLCDFQDIPNTNGLYLLADFVTGISNIARKVSVSDNSLNGMESLLANPHAENLLDVLATSLTQPQANRWKKLNKA